MGKQYQSCDSEASTLELTIPEEVTVALAEIAHSATEGLLALSVGAGLQVMQTLDGAVGRPQRQAQPRPGCGAPRSRAGLGGPGWPPPPRPAAAGAGRRRLG
jgi:hypothetical protein